MTGQSAFKCSPADIRRHVVSCMFAGLVPFVKSSPGMGKSSIIKSIAQEYRLKVIDVRLSQATPEDLQGLPRFRQKIDKNGNIDPNETIAEFVPFDTFPTTNSEIPEGYDGWLLFFDEFNSGSKAVQAAMYKIILDRMVGQKTLHSNVAIVCAGNLETDRAIVNPMSTAMQSRLVHLTLTIQTSDFLKNIAYPNFWDERIIAFLSYKETALHDFEADHSDATFCCPRTWEFMNRLIKGKEVRNEDAALYAGTITSGVATEFITFTKVYNSLPHISNILKDPENCPVPTDPAVRFATVVHLIGKVSIEDANLEPIATYVNRMTGELRVVFFRGLVARHPTLQRDPIYRRALLELSKYLNDDDDKDLTHADASGNTRFQTAA